MDPDVSRARERARRRVDASVPFSPEWQAAMDELDEAEAAAGTRSQPPDAHTVEQPGDALQAPGLSGNDPAGADGAHG